MNEKLFTRPNKNKPSLHTEPIIFNQLVKAWEQVSADETGEYFIKKHKENRRRLK